MGKQFRYIVIHILLQTATGFSMTFAQDSISSKKEEFQPMSFQIQEVVIRPQKERYSRHDNPAVDLIRNVIEHKKKNRIENKEKYQVEIYEKLSLSVDYFKMDIEKNFLLKNFLFMKNYVDTSEIKGKSILTLSVREAISDYYYRKEPQTEKTITKAKRHQGLDQPFDNNGTLSGNLDEIFKNVNIFDDDLTVLLNKFVSPLSSTLATVYYKYYIMDTLDVAGDACVNLAFVPVNAQGYGFVGQLYITLDGHYAVKKVMLSTSRNINLNWADQLRIEQDFNREPDSTWVMSKEDIYANFYPVEGVEQLYAHRLRSFNAYNFAPEAADSVFQLPGAVHVLPEAEERPDIFWTNHRPVPLRDKEVALKALMVELKGVPVFNVLMKTLEIAISGYVSTTADNRKSLFDFGPVYATFSSNFLEGLRLRVGGVTTANLHPQWFAGGYLAYGLDDRKVKYQTKLTHSFNKKKYHENETPINNLSLLHGYDVYVPGADFLSDKDNLFAVKIGKQETKMQYIRRTELQYEKEWLNHLSMKIWTMYEKNQPAGTLQYNQYQPDGTFTAIPRFTLSEVGLQLRFAPKEKKYDSREGKSSAFNLSKDAPIFKISHQMGFSGIFQSDYGYNHTEASAEKRIWLSAFGHIDSYLKAGKVWNRVPFPLLILPATNQSIMIEPEMFMMMRAMEFISDEYASFFMTYYMKGLIMNRIPLIRKLKFREVISVSGMYGKLSDKNNPLINPTGLFQLPEEASLFGREPYMEASVGIENIFKIVRIDYFRRLTYLNAPNIKKDGFRIAFRFSF